MSNSVSIFQQGKIVCPRCGELAPRVKRRLRDRIISLFTPVKRYRCDFCDWQESITSSGVPFGRRVS